MINISKQITLNSSQARIRNFPENNSTIFYIPNLYRKEAHIVYSTISVNHAEIPISYYVVNSSNNTLVIDVIDDTIYTYTLTEGNYNATTFIEMFLSVVGVNWTLTLVKSTGKYILEHSTNNFTIINLLSTCQKILGFRNDVSSTLKIATLPYPCNFLSASSLKIKSQIIKSTGNLDASGHDESLITIPQDVGMYEVCIYENRNNFHNFLFNEELNSIDISITDENNQLLDFNGIDWTITLQITEYRNNIPVQETLNSILERN